jgi:hypothetical protein
LSTAQHSHREAYDYKMRVLNHLCLGTTLLLYWPLVCHAGAIFQQNPQELTMSSPGYKNVAYFVNWVRPFTAYS